MLSSFAAEIEVEEVERSCTVESAFLIFSFRRWSTWLQHFLSDCVIEIDEKMDKAEEIEKGQQIETEISVKEEVSSLRSISYHVSLSVD